MIVDITSELGGVVIGASGLEEILQNVKTILATVKGSVPLDREFGVDATLIDTPEPVAMARLSSGIVTAVETYEPRVRVVSVGWAARESAQDGKLSPSVRVKVREGVTI